jgi:putative SOS response-associated peptidase YedK
MCNEYQLSITRALLAQAFLETRIPIRWADDEPNREVEAPFRPTDRATIIRPVNPADPMAGVEGSPTFREAYRRRRCLVPLTSFIEYDEPQGWKKGQPKRRNEITWPGGGVRYFAGLWERSTPADMMEGLESFTFLTGPAPPDIVETHDRTPPVLTLEQGIAWLDLAGPGKIMLEELPPAGTYEVAEAPRASVIGAAMRKALP